MPFLISIIVFTTARILFADNFFPVSAIRKPHESFAEAKRRALRAVPEAEFLDSGSAMTDAVPLKKLDLDQLHVWKNQTELWKAFQRGRDERFLRGTVGSPFLRRLSWLYPDDGCFIRADLLSENLQKWNYPRPSKVFAFGDLRVNTLNSPNGFVLWWYHVAPGVRIGSKAFILDPAIDPTRPLLLQEWLDRMQPWVSSEITLSICHPDTLLPTQECGAPAKIQNRVLFSPTYFLDAEWHRLLTLGRKPDKELGEEPPWKEKG